MHGSMKKMMTAAAASFIALTSVLSAQEYGWDNSGCCDYAYTRPCRPVCNPECGNWWIDGEALWWKTCETGVALGADNSLSSETIDGVTFTGVSHYKVKDFDFGWDWGFRIGAGYNMPCDWDIALYWTHFYTTASANMTGTATAAGVGSNPNVDPFYSVFSTDNFVTNVRGHLKSDLDLVDVELGRDFFLSQCFSLRPFIGARGAWVQQKLRSHILSPLTTPTNTTGGQVNVASTTLDMIEDVHMKNDYAGGGLRAGLNSEWNLGCGFSLFGQVAASLLYGEHRVHYQSTEYTVGTGTEGSSIDFNSSSSSSLNNATPFGTIALKDSFCACRAVTDLGLGVRWKYFFDCDSSVLTFSLGWEQHKFFDMNHFEYLSPVYGATKATVQEVDTYESSVFDKGDLCFQGITLSAQYDF